MFTSESQSTENRQNYLQSSFATLRTVVLTSDVQQVSKWIQEHSNLDTLSSKVFQVKKMLIEDDKKLSVETLKYFA